MSEGGSVREKRERERERGRKTAVVWPFVCDPHTHAHTHPLFRR